MYDLAVIVPVRRGSSRIVDKSMLPFGGYNSLIEWKLSQLVKVIDPWRIYLSSEDEEFLALARKYGASTHRRPLRLATGHIASFSEVITGIVSDIHHEHIAWCTVVCPLMSPQEYVDTFQRYHDDVIHGDHDSLVGVNLMKEYFWEKEGALNYQADRNHTISQNLPDWYKVTNSVYMCPKADIMTQGYFLGERPVLQPLSKISGIDIDYIEDYRMARALYGIYEEDGLDQVRPETQLSWPQPLRMAVGS